MIYAKREVREEERILNEISPISIFSQFHNLPFISTVTGNSLAKSPGNRRLSAGLAPDHPAQHVIRL
jgi:hypothetical protein